MSSFILLHVYAAIGLLCVAHGSWHSAHRSKVYWKCVIATFLWFALWPLVVGIRLFIVVKRAIFSYVDKTNPSTKTVCLPTQTVKWLSDRGANFVILKSDEFEQGIDRIQVEGYMTYGGVRVTSKYSVVDGIHANDLPGLARGHVLLILDKDHLF